MISTIIPVYIREDDDLLRLKKALDSLSFQEYKSSEVIISDDTKDELQIRKLKDLLSNSDLPINYISHPSQSNASMNTNFGILSAKNNIVHILHQDDWLISNKYYSFVVDALGIQGYSWVLAIGITDGHLNVPTFTRALPFGFNSIGGPSALAIKKRDWIPLDGDFLLLPDVVQFNQMLEKYGIPYITSEPCVEYGTGMHKMTNRITKKDISEDISKLYNKKVVNNLPFIEFVFGVKYWGNYLELVCESIISDRKIPSRIRFQAKLIRAICKIYINLIEIKKIISSVIPKFHRRNHL